MPALQLYRNVHLSPLMIIDAWPVMRPEPFDVRVIRHIKRQANVFLACFGGRQTQSAEATYFPRMCWCVCSQSRFVLMRRIGSQWYEGKHWSVLLMQVFCQIRGVSRSRHVSCCLLMNKNKLITIDILLMLPNSTGGYCFLHWCFY